MEMDRRHNGPMVYENMETSVPGIFAAGNVVHVHDLVDTPNNTIGLFWYDSDKYFSIFPREFENTEGLKRPTPRSLKQQKAARTAQNYLSATRRAQNE